MPDHLTPTQRTRAMKRVKLKDGSLEKLVQRELLSQGLKFRRHVRALPGSPDIVFPKEKLAVFVDGDFWHGWRFPVWKDKLSVKWEAKIAATRARDQRNFRRLRRRGWIVVRIWEHEVHASLAEAVSKVLAGLAQRGASRR